jgi:hypothetical protein
MPKIGEVQKRMRALAVVGGLREHVASGEALSLDGKKLSKAKAIALFQAHLDALDAVRTTRAQLAAQIRNERAIHRQVSALMPALVAWVQMKFGATAVTFARFGLALPKKRGPKTIFGKAHGAEKARATRTARKTMGKRQRLRVRGTVPPDVNEG